MVQLIGNMIQVIKFYLLQPVDEYNNNVYIGSDSGNVSCLDTRDGTFKWAYSTGDKVRSTPALYDGGLVIGSNDGNAYILNKFTGECNFSFNPGYFFFNNPISASPVIYGDSLFISGHDGYLYSLNNQKMKLLHLYFYIMLLLS